MWHWLRHKISYAAFWLKASNSKGHGMHSPFVFSLIEHVLNDDRYFYGYQLIKPTNSLSIKNAQLLFRIINHFHHQKIFIVDSNSFTNYSYLSNHQNTVQVIKNLYQLTTTFDCLFINDGSVFTDNEVDLFVQLSNESSFIIINNISTGNNNLWLQLQQHHTTTASINLFSLGIILFNQDFKIKQHFSVRF